MSEYYDQLITDAFEQFTAQAAPGVRATGTAAVRATAAHRRKVRIAALSVLGALAIAIPVAALAANPHGNNGPPVSGMTESPSSSPSPIATAEPGLGAPALEQIVAVKPTLPAGAPCPTGSGSIRSLPRPDGPTGSFDAVVIMGLRTNLDGDADTELAVLFVCAPAHTYGETSTPFVVAFDRDDRGGIVATGIVAKAGQGERIISVEGRPGQKSGIVAAYAVDTYDVDNGDLRRQRREFAWNGGGFVQVAGPTSFPPQPKTDLKLTATDLQLGPAQNGTRQGKITVTVTNNGPLRSGEIQVIVPHPAPGIWMVETTWVGLYTHPEWPQLHAPIASGQSITVTVTVVVDERFTADRLQLNVSAGSADPNLSNNTVDIDVVRA